MKESNGLTTSQSLNLLRHVLRAKMGDKDFNSRSELLATGKEGQKDIATVFEDLTQSYLDSQGIKYVTEKTLRERANRPVEVFFNPIPFELTGKVHKKSKQPMYRGLCVTCGGLSLVPFQPRGRKLNTMQCWNCMRGKPRTSDFLLAEPILINGRSVSWIDSKLFYGSACTTQKSIREQASFFTEAYGNGALVFALGFCGALEVDGATVLCASPFEPMLGPMWDALGTQNQEMLPSS